MNIENIGIAQIKVGENTRSKTDKKDLQDLKNSIEASGLLQPVGVKEIKPGQFNLVWGFRRLECFKLLNKLNIPAVVVKSDDEHALKIIENLQRKDIAPIELAAAIKKYRTQSKLSLTEIAKLIGKSLYEVSRINKLNDLIPQLQKVLEKGELNLDAAYYTSRFPDSEQKELLLISVTEIKM